MQVDAGLSANVVCLRKERVMLTLRDGDGRTASVEMAAPDAVHLAHVLSSEMHGSCPDTWLVERVTGTSALWLTLSSTQRGFVRVSRIEVGDDLAEHLADRLLAVAAECTPTPRSTPPWRQAVDRALRKLSRWITASPAAPHQSHAASLPCDR